MSGRVHWQLWPQHQWAPCGPATCLTQVPSEVTCKRCLRYMNDSPEKRQERFARQRQRAALRRKAQRIVLTRHADEVERELAVLVLGALGDAA